MIRHFSHHALLIPQFLSIWDVESSFLLPNFYTNMTTPSLFPVFHHQALHMCLPHRIYLTIRMQCPKRQPRDSRCSDSGAANLTWSLLAQLVYLGHWALVNKSDGALAAGTATFKTNQGDGAETSIAACAQGLNQDDEAKLEGVCGGDIPQEVIDLITIKSVCTNDFFSESISCFCGMTTAKSSIASHVDESAP